MHNSIIFNNYFTAESENIAKRIQNNNVGTDGVNLIKIHTENSESIVKN